MSQFDQRCQWLQDANFRQTLTGITRGLEKECLRITSKGELAQTPHPKSLGSALTHPSITTDYSEALLEFITEPHQSIPDLLTQLHDIHHYTYHNINDELLWVNSMPCMLSDDSSIPIAQYGRSNTGQMKTIYRRGLGHRYGRKMQTIAGLHFNFSMPDSFWQELQQREGDNQSLSDFKTQRYFDLIRNFRRHFWLLLYLFGASPAICRSFVKGRQHQLTTFGDDAHSLYSPYATSLRMGDLGYQSDAQKQLMICYNDLDNYISTLCQAINQPHKAYADIGEFNGLGTRQQLNSSLLQIENEFYSTVRPKRTAKSGETALSALSKHGVEYIEVRCIDLDPFLPLGISESQIRFLDTFLLHCLLKDSPQSNDTEHRNISANQRRMVYQGRDPQLNLLRGNNEVSLKGWAQELMQEMQGCAQLLDANHNSSDYQDALAAENLKLDAPELTPAGKIVSQMSRQNKTFFRVAMDLCEQQQQLFMATPPNHQQAFAESAALSLQQQAELEAQDQGDFEQHLQAYYQQYHCCKR